MIIPFRFTLKTIQVHDKSQLYLRDDGSLLRCPKHLSFLAIDPPWCMSCKFDCSLCLGHLLPRRPPLWGRGSAVYTANVLTPSWCRSRAGTHDPVVYRNSSSVLRSPTGAGAWLLKSCCVSVTRPWTLTPVLRCQDPRARPPAPALVSLAT